MAHPGQRLKCVMSSLQTAGLHRELASPERCCTYICSIYIYMDHWPHHSPEEQLRYLWNITLQSCNRPSSRSAGF